MTDSIISALRERLRKTGASQAEIDALEELVAAREELVEALGWFLSATISPMGHVIGLTRDDFDQARAALAKHKPAE